jgi:hypothetical protein
VSKRRNPNYEFIWCEFWDSKMSGRIFLIDERTGFFSNNT